GFRIELGEIEWVLRSYPGVREAVVLLRSSDGRGPQLVAYVAGDDPAAQEAGELRRFLAEKLPDYMVPSAFVALESLPLGPNGKIDRAALPAPQDLAVTAYRPPRDRFELELARIWEELLRAERVGLDDSFFDLGGHSLLAVGLMARIEQRFGQRIPLTALFQEATLERLARNVREQARDAPSTSPVSPLVPIRLRGNAPPWFFVHPVGGQVHWYLELARALGEDHPIFGLQAPGLMDRELRLTDVPRMAAVYLSAIREAQPEGPYFLAGWSVGGVIAFEMARALRSLAQPVGALVLIDTLQGSQPGAETGEDEVSLWIDLIADLAGAVSVDRDGWWKALQPLDHEQRLAHVAAELTHRSLLPPGLGAEYLERMLGVHFATRQAIRSYEPVWSAGAGTLVRAAATVERHAQSVFPLENTFGWAPLFGGGLTVHDVPGTHYSILEKDRVAALASILSALHSGDHR
ncbi:MAG TPA: thioesterase domain-containing protein, partial [Thermoanaerobaculia bacterium]